MTSRPAWVAWLRNDVPRGVVGAIGVAAAAVFMPSLAYVVALHPPWLAWQPRWCLALSIPLAIALAVCLTGGVWAIASRYRIGSGGLATALLTAGLAAVAGTRVGMDVLPQPQHIADLVITATGNKASEARGSEVWFLGAEVQGKPVPWTAYSLDPSWERRDDAVVSYRQQPASIVLPKVSAGQLQLHFLWHPWSGQVVLHWGLHQKTVDLFAKASKAGRRTITFDTRPLTVADLAMGGTVLLPGLLAGLLLAVPRVRAIAFAALPVLPVVLLAMAASPGIYTEDSQIQLMQALSGHYEDWYPPIMAALWSGLIALTGRPEAMFWFHIGLFAAGMLGWAAVLRRVGSRQLAAVLLLLCGLDPALLSSAGVLWKDVSLAFTLNCASAAAAALYLDRRLGRTSRTWQHVALLGALALLLFYAVSVRVNAAPAVIPILALAAWAMLPEMDGSNDVRRRSGAACGIGVAGTLVLWLGAGILDHDVLHAERQHIEQFGMLYDIAGIGVASGDFRFPERFELRYYTPQKIVESYSPILGNYLFFLPDSPLVLHFKNDAGTGAQAALRHSWIGDILDHPGAYMTHRARVFASLLRIGYAEPYYYVLPYEQLMPRSGTHFSGQTTLLGWLESWIRLAARFTPMFFGWFWAAILLIVLAAAWLNRRHVAAPIALTVGGSGLMYMAPYLVIAIASDFRYLLWSVLSATIGAAVVCCSASGDRLPRLVDRLRTRIGRTGHG